ncbi:MAG TPA: hypothetical protein VK530_19700 [Candidatus Acidoferrum sp.]|nr:hypothetical protein [Candidatus Acidoferrum sp.]
MRDPVTGQPVALLEDSSAWLWSAGSAVLQGAVSENPGALAIVRVEDALPEFWADPSVHNRMGPTVFSGFGKDAGPREWAGRPAFDRRAYALDPGWELQSALAPPASSGVNIQITISNSVTLHWHALPGRVYGVDFTPSLNQPFQTVRTNGSPTEQNMSVTLPLNTVHGFYRIAEQTD